jgi:hypothetical protein
LLAGLVFALLAFKPQLILVIGAAMLIMRRWRFVGGAFIGGVALFAASLAVSPFATLQYVKIAPDMSDWIDMPGMPLERMSCWYGFWRLIFDGQPLWLAQVATVVCSLATIVLLIWIVRRSRSSSSAVCFAGLVLGTIVLSPHLLSYDLTLLLLPLFVMVSRAVGGEPVRSPRALRLWALLLFAGAAFSEPVAAATRIQVVVPLMVLMLVVLARATSRPEEAA